MQFRQKLKIDRRPTSVVGSTPLTTRLSEMNTQCFRDFDAFADSVADVNSSMLIQNPRRSRWTLIQSAVGGIHLQHGREGSGNITEGQSRGDGFIIFAPLNNAAAHAGNRIALDETRLAILEPGADFCIRCETEHDWYAVFIPTDRFVNGLEPASTGSQPT